MSDSNIIAIPGSEFNSYRKFVRDIILYHFNHTNKFNTIDFEYIKYNKSEKSITITLKTTYKEFSNIVITYARFAQFINDQFNLQEIIDKYDTSDKIVYSEELKKMDSAMFKNPNVVVICYDHNFVSEHGEERKLLSVTPNRFYLVEKVGSKYKLLTHNNFDKQTENCIYINADSRSIEYKIKEWNFTKNDIFPIIGGRVVDITVELKKGAFNRGKIANTLVEFVVSEKTTCDVIDYYFRKSKELVDRQTIARWDRKPCSEIILPRIISSTPTGANNFYDEFVSYNDRSTGIIPTQPLSDPKPEVLYYMDYFYTDDVFDPNEFLLNHKVTIKEHKTDLSLGMSEEFLHLL